MKENHRGRCHFCGAVFAGSGFARANIHLSNIDHIAPALDGETSGQHPSTVHHAQTSASTSTSAAAATAQHRYRTLFGSARVFRGRPRRTTEADDVGGVDSQTDTIISLTRPRDADYAVRWRAWLDRPSTSKTTLLSCIYPQIDSVIMFPEIFEQRRVPINNYALSPSRTILQSWLLILFSANRSALSPRHTPPEPVYL